MFYIGETENTLRARVRVLKHINSPEYRQIHVTLSEHLDVCGHKQFHIFQFKNYQMETIFADVKKKKILSVHQKT